MNNNSPDVKRETISVLLTCYNRRENTLQCLHALYGAQLPVGSRLDVFLVDDGSTDGTAAAVNENFPNVKIIKGSGQLFWNRGMHLAWQTAANANDYDYYLWLNDDTIVSKNALTTLLETSRSANDTSIVVGTTCDSDNSLLLTYGGRDNEGNIIIPDGSITSCDYFNGNIVWIPRKVFKVVGFNDVRFNHALGDFDYGKRASKKGIKSCIAPVVIGVCNNHATLPVWCNPKKPLSQRWKAFRTPLGHNPEEFFRYEYRHNGILVALFHYMTNHLRVIFPSFWV